MFEIHFISEKNDKCSTYTISLLWNTPTVYSKCVTNAAACTHTHTYYRLFVTKSGSDLYALFMFQNVELCRRSKNSKINTNVIIGWRDVVRKRHTCLQRCCERITPTNMFSFSDNLESERMLIWFYVWKERAFDETVSSWITQDITYTRRLPWFNFIWQYKNITIEKQFEFNFGWYNIWFLMYAMVM